MGRGHIFEEVSSGMRDLDAYFENGGVITHSPGIWNLPASKGKCLEALLYAKMADIPFTREESNYSYCYKGDLPYIQYYDQKHGNKTALNFIKSKVNLDELIIDKEKKVLANALVCL